jgi:hypothetical protein
MAHFITLFFLSLGLNFGNTDVTDNKKNVENLQNSSLRVHNLNNKRPALQHNLYSNKLNTKKVHSIGVTGWDPD